MCIYSYNPTNDSFGYLTHILNISMRIDVVKSVWKFKVVPCCVPCDTATNHSRVARLYVHSDINRSSERTTNRFTLCMCLLFKFIFFFAAAAAATISAVKFYFVFYICVLYYFRCGFCDFVISFDFAILRIIRSTGCVCVCFFSLDSIFCLTTITIFAFISLLAFI